MKVKHVVKDLGPEARVQIYAPSNSGYEKCFVRAYAVGFLIGVHGIDIIGKYLDRDIDHVEYSHYYTTDDMVASCNIYLKAEEAIREEKPSAIDYTDLKKKWERFRKEYCLEGADPVRAGHISLFLTMLGEGGRNND